MLRGSSAAEARRTDSLQRRQTCRELLLLHELIHKNNRCSHLPCSNNSIIISSSNNKNNNNNNLIEANVRQHFQAKNTNVRVLFNKYFAKRCRILTAILFFVTSLICRADGLIESAKYLEDSCLVGTYSSTERNIQIHVACTDAFSKYRTPRRDCGAW
ncbi:hypothetical protein HELRODRAFT_180672 [Helobdella robusta]|uniref:Uncharacterized protein n=1 Tax=Helobdella robusta TaxID=6412 RepID=T1FG55_HELRO|nr:hypothetical protein HELRODRAFT_180672 [Helobdella robusta]ESN93585.1 hypothetical protein HELRODRAFT_180672 [Helobdella robusta]